MTKEMLKDFLKGIEYLRGEEYIQRVLCFMKIFKPEDERDEKEMLDYAFNVRKEILV